MPFLGNYETPIDQPTDGHEGSWEVYTSNKRQQLETSSVGIRILNDRVFREERYRRPAN